MSSEAATLYAEAKALGRSTTTLLPFVKCFKSRNAGVLLSQIAYWYLAPDKHGNSKLRVSRGGHMWAVKTAAQWQAESGLSVYQYKTALHDLKARGVLVVESHLFAFATGPTKATWIRIDQQRLAAELTAFMEREAQAELDDALMQQGVKAENLPIDQHVSCLSSLLTGKTAVMTLAALPLKDTGPAIPLVTATGKPPANKTHNPGLDTKPEPGDTLTLCPDEEVKMPPRNRSVDSAEITAQSAKARTLYPSAQTDTGNGLFSYWRRCAIEHGAALVAPVTVKQLARFKYMLKHHGAESAKAAIEFAFSDWSAFSSRVKLHEGLDSITQVPKLSTFLDYHFYALQLIAERQEKAAAALAAKKPVTLAKPQETPKVSPVPAAAAPVEYDDEIDWNARWAALKKKG